MQQQFPRVRTEHDEVGRAIGKAIDDTLSRISHEFDRGRRISGASVQAQIRQTFDEELRDADVVVEAPARQQQLEEAFGVVQAFRRSPIMGLPRPRSRLILIDEEVGVYAQPDYWDGRSRFYEMKSYRAVPMPPDIVLQINLFQLAFPECEAFLAWFDRHATPVQSGIDRVDPLGTERTRALLQLALQAVRSTGVEKVLEYVDSPVVRYTSRL